jgi:hypothetical protein
MTVKLVLSLPKIPYIYIYGSGQPYSSNAPCISLWIHLMFKCCITPQTLAEFLPAFLSGHTSCKFVVLLFKCSLVFSPNFSLETPNVCCLHVLLLCEKNTSVCLIQCWLSLWKHIMFKCCDCISHPMLAFSMKTFMVKCCDFLIQCWLSLWKHLMFKCCD